MILKARERKIEKRQTGEWQREKGGRECEREGEGEKLKTTPIYKKKVGETSNLFQAKYPSKFQLMREENKPPFQLIQAK